MCTNMIGVSFLCVLVLFVPAGAKGSKSNAEASACAYEVVKIVGTLEDAAVEITEAVKGCPKGEATCAKHIMLALGDFLKTAGSSLALAGCYSESFGYHACAATSLDLSGVVLGLGTKSISLAEGSCNPPAELPATKEIAGPKEISSKCVANVASAVVPLTKLALAIAFDLKFCENIGSAAEKDACMKVAIAQTSNLISLASYVIKAVGSCGEIPGFNGACAADILKVTQGVLDLGDDIWLLTKACPTATPRLRLYEELPDVQEKFRAIEIPQAVSWSISGVLLFMMPFVFCAGRRLSPSGREVQLASSVLAEE